MRCCIKKSASMWTMQGEPLFTPMGHDVEYQLDSLKEFDDDGCYKNIEMSNELFLYVLDSIDKSRINEMIWYEINRAIFNYAQNRDVNS